jgi:hypothetical protein
MAQRRVPEPLRSTQGSYETDNHYYRRRDHQRGGGVFRPVRNGLPGTGPEFRPYRYGGDGGTMTEAQVQAHLAGVRARLATSAAARDAALTPPKLIVLRAVPDPEVPGGEVFEQPEPKALPAPAPDGLPAGYLAEGWKPRPEPERCEACGYRMARCACPGGPRGTSTAPPPTPVTTRCRRCGYLTTRCACEGRRD